MGVGPAPGFSQRGMPAPPDTAAGILQLPALRVVAAPRPAERVEIEDSIRQFAGSRAMNVSLAAVALVLASPLMLILALLVVASSPGPVLYVQDRVGVNRRRGLPASGDRRASDIGGQRFRIYKFRTMMVDAERETGAVWACPDDPRVTRIGRYMRRYRLDEMPQLFNVLRGEMNIVGPRPERPSIFADLCRQIPDYADRQRAMPGITGLAQIRHHYDRSVEDVLIKLAYDLDYVTNRSAWMDLRIMAATLPAVLFRARGW